jgi:OFA family oxalate/formate antiporter-like MFS transporter
MAVETSRSQQERRDGDGSGRPPATGRRRPKIYYGYWLIGAALVAQFVSVGTQNSVSGAFMKPMNDELGWARSDFTYAQTIGRFMMSFVGFFIGVYIDRWGGRRFMFIGVTVLAAALFATAYVNELWQWVVLRGFIFTLGAALIGNLVVNVTLSKWFVEKRGRVIGFSSMGVSLAGVVMPPLATWLIEGWGWRTAWQVIGIGALFLIYPAAMVMRRQPEDYGLHPDGKSDEEIRQGGGAAAARDFANSFTRREALRTRSFYLIVASFGLGGIGIGAMLLHTIPFLTDEGFSPTTAALMASVMSAPAFFSKPVWGWLVDKWEPKKLASVGFAMSGTAMIIILAAAKANALIPLVVGYLLMGWGFGGQIPLQETIWASYFGRRYLGSVRSVAMPFSLALGAGGPLAIAFYFDFVGNYDGALLTVGALWYAGALLVLFVKRPLRPEPAVPAPATSPSGLEVLGPGAAKMAQRIEERANGRRGPLSRIRLRRNGRNGSGPRT